MSTVLVAGGAGYVGSHAVKGLAAAGYDVERMRLVGADRNDVGD